MSAYYNEKDPFAAQWLRNLIAAGLIAPGFVDERSIEDVTAQDLAGYTQCHFFAGVGVWSYALRLAGWRDDWPVWTASCPCQPFSAAGEGAGFADERHLWPAFYHLASQCKPPIVFGEQVASKDADAWIDLVQADMEAMGYAFGAVPFPSASIGGPHIRDRLYWLGHADDSRLERHARYDRFAGWRGTARPAPASGVSGRLADADGGHASTERLQRGVEHGQLAQDGRIVRLADLHGDGCDHAGQGVTTAGNDGVVRNGAASGPGPLNGFWSDADWIFCRDGKWRPVESGSFPLVNGAPSRMGRLRAYGNAINPWQAAAFIEAFIEGMSAEDAPANQVSGVGVGQLDFFSGNVR
jgi:DNA (cytosine-5)-methyltransferase 1